MARRLKVYFRDEDEDRKINTMSRLPSSLFEICEDRLSFDIICGHNVNLKGFNQGRPETDYASNFPERLIVIYSGAGNPKLSKIDIESGRVCRLIRTIERAKDGITTEEWEQIYELIDGDSFTNHEIQPIQLDYLSALSILCQGYLANNSDSENVIVKVALKAMGWDAEIIHIDLSDKKSETKKKDWWLEPFTPETIDEIYKQIVNEWNKNQYSKTCDHVYYLLQALKQETIEDPTIVANAYLAISHRLAHESP